VWIGKLYGDSAARQKTDSDSPRVVFDRQVFDSGLTRHGATIHARFDFRNTGNGVLRIKNIVKSCGCTTPKLSCDSIGAGESGYLLADVNTSGRYGKQEQTVLLETNDPANPRVILRVCGDVEYPIICRPEVVDFGVVEQSARITRCVDVEADRSSVPEVILTEAKTSGIACTLTRKTIPSSSTQMVSATPKFRDDAYTLTVGIDPMQMPEGRFEQTLVVQNAQGAVRIPIRGQILKTFGAEPSQVVLGIVSSGEVKERTVVITDRSGKSLHIKSVDTDIRGLEIQIGDGTRQSQSVLKIRYRLPANEMEGDRDIRGKIVVSMLPGEQTVELPVYIMSRKAKVSAATTNDEKS
jgi:hypothetical protein